MVAKEHLQDVSQAFVTMKGQRSRLLTWEGREGLSRGIYPGKSPPKAPPKARKMYLPTFVTIKGQRLLTWGEEEEEEEGLSRGIYPGKSPPEVPCKIVSIKVKTQLQIRISLVVVHDP